MLIATIKDALRNQHTMSLFDMSTKFNIDAHVLRDMLAILIRKGQVRKCTKTPQCGTKCSKCDLLVTEMYEWVN